MPLTYFLGLKIGLIPKKCIFCFLFRCAPDWESNRHLSFTIYWLIMGWLGPMAVIVYSSAKTVCIMKRVSSTLFTHLDIYLCCLISANSTHSIRNDQTHVSKKRAQNLLTCHVDEHRILHLLDSLWSGLPIIHYRRQRVSHFFKPLTYHFSSHN